MEMTSEAKKDFSLYDAKGLKISLCAVVGRNGAEKSTIVELLGIVCLFREDRLTLLLQYIFSETCTINKNMSLMSGKTS